MNFSTPKFLALGVTAACSVGLGLFWVYLRNSSTPRITSQASTASRTLPPGKKKKPVASSKKKPVKKKQPEPQQQPSSSKLSQSDQERIGARIKQLLDEADVFKQKHQYAKAQKAYLELITLVEGSFGKYSGACFYSYQALAILLTQIRELTLAAQITEKYLDIARHLPNAEDKVVEALSELAFLYFQLERFADSLLYNSEARAIAEKLALAPKTANAEAITASKRAYIDWTISRVEHQTAELKKADLDCRSALEWLSRSPPTDSLRLDVQVSHAMILFDLNKREEALQLFNGVATEIWTKFSSDLATLLQYVRLLVKAEMDRGVYELAVEQCQRAIVIAADKDDLRDSANAIRSELSTIRRFEGREEDAKELDRQVLDQIRSIPALVPPYTTSRFVITHSALLLPPSSGSDSSALLSGPPLTRLTYNLTLKFREEIPITQFPGKTLLPANVLITVMFENPANAAAPVKINTKKEAGERQLKISSPALDGFKVGVVYKCSVYFVDADSKALLGEHTQYFKLFDNSEK